MKARDVLVDAWTEWGDSNDVRPLAEVLIDALLATTPPGEGVYIAPDGGLWRLDGWPVSAASEWSTTRLVSIEGDDRE